MRTHIQNTQRENTALREGRRQGMTLIEVVISMALFSIILCAFMGLQFSTLQADRISTLQMAGTVALRGQMEQSVASAYNNMESKTNIAQGLLSYFSAMSTRGADVRLVGDTIVHTFPVSFPGEALAAGAGNLFRNAVGTFTVYLRESSVPSSFVTWGTFHNDGSVDANSGGFDMNGDRTTGDDFSGLFTGGEAAIAGSGLSALPVQGEIRYYNSAKDLAAGAFAYSVTRNFIINGDLSVTENYEQDIAPQRTIPE